MDALFTGSVRAPLVGIGAYRRRLQHVHGDPTDQTLFVGDDLGLAPKWRGRIGMQPHRCMVSVSRARARSSDLRASMRWHCSKFELRPLVNDASVAA